MLLIRTSALSENDLLLAAVGFPFSCYPSCPGDGGCEHAPLLSTSESLCCSLTSLGCSIPGPQNNTWDGAGWGGVAILSEGRSRVFFFHACHKVGHDANLMAKSVKGELTGESGEELGLVSCGLS